MVSEEMTLSEKRNDGEDELQSHPARKDWLEFGTQLDNGRSGTLSFHKEVLEPKMAKQHDPREHTSIWAVNCHHAGWFSVAAKHKNKHRHKRQNVTADNRNVKWAKAITCAGSHFTAKTRSHTNAYAYVTVVLGALRTSYAYFASGSQPQTRQTLQFSSWVDWGVTKSARLLLSSFILSAHTSYSIISCNFINPKTVNPNLTLRLYSTVSSGIQIPSPLCSIAGYPVFCLGDDFQCITATRFQKRGCFDLGAPFSRARLFPNSCLRDQEVFTYTSPTTPSSRLSPEELRAGSSAELSTVNTSSVFPTSMPSGIPRACGLGEGHASPLSPKPGNELTSSRLRSRETVNSCGWFVCAWPSVVSSDLYK